MPDLTTGMGSLTWGRLSQFLSWWLEELAALLPAPVRNLFFSDGRSLLLEVTGNEVQVHRVSAGGRELLGSYPLTSDAAVSASRGPIEVRARELVLCLTHDQVLVKEVKLPLATEENLRQVLAFEMSRQTPFAAPQVYFDYKIVSRDRERRCVVVELCVAQREQIDEWLDKLKHGLGLYPDRVTSACDETGNYAPINLLPTQRRPRWSKLQRRVNSMLGVLALLLLAAVVAQPIWEKKQTIQALHTQLDSISQEARAAHRLGETVDQLREQARFLADRKQNSLLVLQVMDELTGLLPDDTWISNIEIRNNEVQLHGNSSTAAALIATLESSPYLHNARFRSPVTRNRQANSERVHLSAEIGRESDR